MNNNIDVKPTVFVVDDDHAVRQSLELLIRSVGLRAETYASAQEFLDALDPARPGCLVLDIRMPGMSGLELQRYLRERNIGLPIIMVTGHGDVPVAVRALKNGAVDFIEKPFSKQLLLERIRDSLDQDGRLRQEQARQAGIQNRLKSLTPRERSVMELVVSGKSNKEVAAELGVSKKTVEVHRAHIMQKMEAESLAELVEQAVTVKLLTREKPDQATAVPQ